MGRLGVGLPRPGLPLQRSEGTRRWSERVSDASRILPKHRDERISAFLTIEGVSAITGPPRARQSARAPSPTFSPENVHL